jgi:hypothetical protein
MKEKLKIILSLSQINNLMCLLKNNEYEQFLYKNLIALKVELNRQLSHYE